LEKDVLIRKVFLDRTISGIQHHQGGSKVTWAWKVNLLEDWLSSVAPALLMQARNIIPSIFNVNTINVFSYADASLHGNGVNTELEVDDAANPNDILAATRATCRWIGMTLTYSPQNAVANGTMVDVANLPEAASVWINFRAPLDPNGLHANLTKDMLVNNPGQIFLTFVNTVFTSIKHGQIPMKDVFDAWMSEQIHKTYFYAMGQIARKMFIGAEIATDTIKQRFHKLSQWWWNHVTRKNDFLAVNEFFNEIVALTNEAKHFDPADVADQVPDFLSGIGSEIQGESSFGDSHSASTFYQSRRELVSVEGYCGRGQGSWERDQSDCGYFNEF
jgi:hypothetical protein